MTGCFEVKSVEETWELAGLFAKTLRPGDVVCLEGDLGAGKTTFTQALARELGVSGRVTSPTFCVVQEHPGERFMVHMDLYRLSGEDDVLDLGWEDYLSRGAIVVVEWPERAGSLVPADAKHVVFSHLEGEEDRKIEFR
jgi:tRNA threonylcarbamoyladenosine biosynthesis protein TsaE